MCVYASILNYWIENSCSGSSTSLNQTFSPASPDVMKYDNPNFMHYCLQEILKIAIDLHQAWSPPT